MEKALCPARARAGEATSLQGGCKDWGGWEQDGEEPWEGQMEEASARGVVLGSQLPEGPCAGGTTPQRLPSTAWGWLHAGAQHWTFEMTSVPART